MPHTLRGIRVAVAALAATAGVCLGQAETAGVRGESAQTRKRLTEIEAAIRAGKHADAADQLQRVLDDAGDDLITADGRTFVPARKYAHRFLAQLPPAARRAYQDRIDEPARLLLTEAKRLGDVRPLRRLLDRYFVARPAEEALNLLGEWSFDRGDFLTAEAAWRRLTPDPLPGDVAFPEPKGDPAAARAKAILAVIFQGEPDRAAQLLTQFRAAHPTAAGALAGATGPYADTLAKLIAAPPKLPPATNVEATWTALGGNASRDGRANAAMPKFWPNAPTWKVRIPRDAAIDADRYPVTPPPVGAARSVALHPVVWNDTAYVADAGRVFGFDLLTGRGGPVFDLRKDAPDAVPHGDLKLPTRFDADFALATAGGKVFARVGAAAIGGPAAPDIGRGRGRPGNFLAGLGFDGGASGLRWKVPPPAPEGVAAYWEGAPIVADGRAIAAVVQSDGGRLVHSLACYDDAGRRLLWNTDVADAPAAGDARMRHDLVTLAGPVAVFCSHTGVVVAVDRATGKPAWAYRYPKPRTLSTKPRDINPPVSADGRVFVAPTDSDVLLAFDADSGRMLWTADGVEVNQLLGVAAGKVIATVNSPARGVRAYDVRTGSTDAPRGWVQHDDPGLLPFGRGLLTDEMVLWPTADGLFFLRTADGLGARQPIPGAHGNLAYAAGVLLVGTPTELWGYVGERRQAEDAGKKAGVFLIRAAADTEPVKEVTQPVRVTLPEPAPLPGPRADVSVPPNVVSGPPPREPEPVKLDLPGEVLGPPISIGGRIIARVGDRHVAAADAATGKLLWVRDAFGRPRFEPYPTGANPRLAVAVAADATHVVAVTTAGRRFAFDAATGAVVQNQPGPPVEYASPAVPLDGGLFAVPTGAATVAAFDPVSGTDAWTFDAGRPPSLAGRAPRIALATAGLFVAVARNIGTDLDLVRPHDGTRAWRSGPAFFAGGDLDPAKVAADGEFVFVPLADRVVALRADTGREVWTAALGQVPGGWTIHPTRAAVVAVPAEAVPAEPVDDVFHRVGMLTLRRADPLRLAGLAGTAYDAWADRTVPVVLLDPATGTERHRLTLSARGPRVRTRATAAGVVIETADAAHLLK